MSLEPEALIPSIYDAAVEPEQWPDILRRLSELTGNSATYLCHVPMTNPAAGYTWLHEFDPASVEAYKRDFAGPHYSGVMACIVNPVGALIDRRAIADDATFERDPGHQALLGSQGLYHGLVSPVFRDQTTLSALLCWRDRRRGPIDQSSTEVLQLLMPHLTRAVGIHQRMARLANDVALLSGTLQNLNLGVVTVASDMTVTFANREAERILSLCDGLNRIRGKLVLGDSDRQSALAAAVLECAKGDIGRVSPYVFARRPSGEADFSLFVSRYHAATQHEWLVHRAGSVATIFLTDPANPVHLPSAEHLAARFGLTASEAEVARLAAAGRGMPYVASALSVSVNTVRTHLKSIYSKLDINHQANLTRRIIESFPPVRI